jgi:putative ABC transport system substrate-binding protein
MLGIRRREFITLVGGAAAWPLAARGQQPAMPVIGFLNPGYPSGTQWQRWRSTTFPQSLAALGFVEGRNVAFEYRWAQAQFDRLPVLAADLVRRGVNVIIAASPPAALAAKAATTTIPVVFIMGEDPIKEGVVASLSRPGGNVTGFSDFRNQLIAKRVQLLRETIPKATVVGLLVNPTNPNVGPDTKDTQDAAVAIGRELRIFNASNEAELETAFQAMAQSQIKSLVVGVDIFFRDYPQKLAALAARYEIPAIFEWRQFAVAGGLMSYGTDENEGPRLVADYTARILKGAKPGDLPVQRSTKFEFVINLKAAQALGVEFPPGLRAIADELIEQ